MTAVINATLVMADHLIPDGVLLIKDGKIADFGEARCLQIPDGCRILDAKGMYVGPGFVDIHSHAGGGASFESEPEKAAQYHLRQGTTTMLATLGTVLTTTRYIEGIKPFHSEKSSAIKLLHSIIS